MAEVAATMINIKLCRNSMESMCLLPIGLLHQDEQFAVLIYRKILWSLTKMCEVLRLVIKENNKTQKQASCSLGEQKSEAGTTTRQGREWFILHYCWKRDWQGPALGKRSPNIFDRVRYITLGVLLFRGCISLKKHLAPHLERQYIFIQKITCY